MNREIKFRVFSTRKKEMLSFTLQDIFGMLDSGKFPVEIPLLIARNEIHIMQYTGLKDKNGVEIYEGDIVKVETEEIFIVRWIVESACFRYAVEVNCDIVDTNSLLNYDEVEVIGNRYENPNLFNQSPTK